MARRNQRYYRTIDLAKAADVHPNTVRLYEKWGLIPAPERSKAGYRLFTRLHLLDGSPTGRSRCPSQPHPATWTIRAAYVTKLMHAPLLVI